MFEEICLVCGRQVDDGRAYCSDVCQNQDTTSPSISSASSPFSSPHMDYAVGGDVPALVPSTLGAPLNNHRRAYPSVSSSSASSTSWSLVTDEEEGDTLLNVESDWEAAYESISKLPAQVNPVYPSGLSYARRPSGTNNRSTIPLLHRRTSSGSSSVYAHCVPRSAPIASCPPSVRIASADDGDDEAYNSDLEFITSHRRLPHHRVRHSSRQVEGWDKSSTITGRVKRTRNRASLPACFSLLTTTGSQKPQNSSPGVQLSPSTPKLTLTGLPHSFGLMQATPRGRRLDAGVTVRGRRKSRSRSPPCSPPPETDVSITQHAKIRERFRRAFEEEEEEDDEVVNVPVPRGRTAMRRNSSPTARMGMNGECGSRTRPRGRLRVEELGGIGCGMNGAGYGSGRSGLVSRERGRQ